MGGGAPLEVVVFDPQLNLILVVVKKFNRK